MKQMQTTWNIIKLILTICAFFWFGWKVGILMIITSIDIKY